MICSFCLIQIPILSSDSLPDKQHEAQRKRKSGEALDVPEEGNPFHCQKVHTDSPEKTRREREKGGKINYRKAMHQRSSYFRSRPSHLPCSNPLLPHLSTHLNSCVHFASAQEYRNCHTVHLFPLLSNIFLPKESNMFLLILYDYKETLKSSFIKINSYKQQTSQKCSAIS